MKKYIVLSFLLLLYFNNIVAQSYDQDRIQLVKFIERMYNNAPFEGCRFVDDYDNSYFLSVVALDPTKYKTPQIMNRVAEVKSQRNAGEFLNGTQSYSEFTIRTPKSIEQGKNEDMVETIEVIKTNSTGFVKQMQIFTTFESKKMNVFVYAKKLTNKTKESNEKD